METDLQSSVQERDHAQGPDTACATLLQYGDYECPVSRRIYETVRAFREAAEGDVRYVYRHFPLNKVHPHAQQAAQAAEAAAQQDRFWSMHERLFEHQDQLEKEDLLGYAERIGLDLSRFKTNLASDVQANRVRKDQRSGLKSGVDTTANLFINGRRYRGELDRRAVADAVEMLTGLKLPDMQKEGADASARPTAYQRSVRDICRQVQNHDTDLLESVLNLAIEIAREGREGRKIGTLFTVGDSEVVLEQSRPLVMDPLLGHPDGNKHIGRPNMREAIKEFAQLDGGFVVDADGVVRSAARYFDASSQGIDLPQGLGSRHMAGASISRNTKAVAVVVSESSMVRIFRDGEVASEIVPELWMLRRYGLEPSESGSGRSSSALLRSGEVAVVERS